MGKGGWRLGAGRPGWRRKIEQCCRLDIRELDRRRLLRDGISTSWRWTNTYSGEEVGSIGLLGGHDRVVLQYSVANDECRRPVSLPVSLTRTPCNYGGSRPWFVCPRCRRRCGVLAYSAGWGCRACLRLAYRSEAEDRSGRLWRRQRKLEQRVGERWQRPKGMHQATFDRIVAQLIEIEEKKDDLLMTP